MCIRDRIHTKYMRDVDVLKEAGASQVFSSESEVALSMACLLDTSRSV